MEIREFKVFEKPIPKGSINVYGKRRYSFVGSGKIKKLSRAIQAKAKEAGVTIASGAVKVRLGFYFQRPKSHYTSKGLLRKGAPREHTRKPDTDKLIRCVLDALTGVAYKDDSQVVEAFGVKHYADHDEIYIMIESDSDV